MKTILLVLTCIFAVLTMSLGIAGVTGTQGINNFSIVSLLITLALLTSFLLVSQKKTTNK